MINVRNGKAELPWYYPCKSVCNSVPLIHDNCEFGLEV